MKNSRAIFLTVAILLLALPLWGLILAEASISTGFGGGSGRYITPPLVLCGLTIALHRLLRPHPFAWQLAALLAGLGTLAVLMAAAG